MSIYLSICLSVILSFYLPPYLSVCLSIFLSITVLPERGHWKMIYYASFLGMGIQKLLQYFIYDS